MYFDLCNNLPYLLSSNGNDKSTPIDNRAAHTTDANSANDEDIPISKCRVSCQSLDRC